MRTILTLLLCAAAGVAGKAQQESYFTNPVIRGDVADPSILRIGQTYYATGTSSEWAPYYPVFSSTDLVNWRPVGHLFDQKPTWAKSSFWAPEWFYHNGKVYVYYTARKESDNISCIGVAVADSPTGKFKDYGPVVEFGSEAIDAFILEDQGKLYISWKAYGLDDRPIELLACRLTDDGLRLDGEPFSLLRDDERQGMEGQHWFKQGGYYYLLYSVRGCCGPQSDYAVSVARSRNLEGPYEKYEGNPILHGSRDILSIGHGTLTTSPDGRMYYLCHAYKAGHGFYEGRQPFLQEIRMEKDLWPHFVTGEYASLSQPMPFAESVQEPIPDFFDRFDGESLRPEWSWNYPFSEVSASIKEGKLALSGNPKPEVKTGAALCLRPTSPDYTIETAIVSKNESWKGITLYGDARNLITMGWKDNRISLKYVMEGEEHLLAEAPASAPAIYMRMKVTDGTRTAFFWSADRERWNELAGSGLPADELRALTRWDRISRPGLYQEGNESALFEYCFLRND